MKLFLAAAIMLFTFSCFNMYVAATNASAACAAVHSDDVCRAILR